MNGMNERMKMKKPKLAIVESNTLAVMGLKQLLETAMPFADIVAFGTFGEFEANDPKSQMSDFHCICVNVSEHILIKELMSLQRMGHPHGEHLPTMDATNKKPNALTDRETEVLSLIAQGKINKEIADQLCIGLTTVITHRKNIQEKLGLKSVSALTIYAVTHGYVDINCI